MCPELHRLSRSVYIPESVFLECRTWLPLARRRCPSWSYIWRRPGVGALVVEVSRHEAEQLSNLRAPSAVLLALGLEHQPGIAEWVVLQ